MVSELEKDYIKSEFEGFDNELVERLTEIEAFVKKHVDEEGQATYMPSLVSELRKTVIEVIFPSYFGYSTPKEGEQTYVHERFPAWALKRYKKKMFGVLYPTPKRKTIFHLFHR